MAKKPQAKRYDIDFVREAARGNWPRLLARAGFDPDILDGKAHPCPKRCSPDAGGKDRFRFTDVNGDGSIYCNQCGRGIGNGFDAVEWLNGQKFSITLAWVAGEFGIEPSVNGSHKKEKESKDPAANLKWQTWSDIGAGYFCLSKPPITPAAIQICGGRIARYYDSISVIALPVWGEKLNAADPVGWCLYHQFGQPLPCNIRDPDGEKTKIKLTYGSKPGWIGPVEQLSAAETVYKLEGPSDLLAFYSLPGIPEGTIALSNAFGAKEVPKEWMLQSLAGKIVNVLHDADKPGQEGAVGYEQNGKPHPGWLELVSQHAAETRHVLLPYEVGADSGNDLRDYLKECKG